MKDRSYHDIIEDQIYLEAYKAAENAFNKKYNKIKHAAKQILHLYESAHGEPDENIKENDWYFKARKLIKS